MSRIECRAATVPASLGMPKGTLSILLVNNASERAFAATTRRIEALLSAACAPRPVALAVVTLGGASAPRQARLAAARLLDRGLDAVVVTGAEPTAASLVDEPSWPALASLFEAAERRAVPLLLSCMASHAAVRHATGIERRSLPRKLFGLYCERRVGEGAMLQGVPDAIPMPHSRWNTVPEAALDSSDIRVLTRSAEGGAGVFVIARDAPWLCLQGHPEYGGAALASEYERDVGRYQAGASDRMPDPPENRVRGQATPLIWQAHGARIVGNWLTACGLHAPATWAQVEMNHA